MDQALAHTIQAEVNAALTEIAKRHGLSASPARGNYDRTGLKLSFVIGESADGEGNPEYVRNLERNGIYYGLNKSFLGKTISIGSRKGLTFQGLKGKKAAFKDTNSKVWLYDAELAAQLLKVTA